MSSEHTAQQLLEGAISTFLPHAEQEEYNTRAGATDNCTHACDEFLHVLEDFGIEGDIEYFEPDIYMDMIDYPWGSMGTSRFHWAIRVGDFVIDWTARQFDEEAPFPAVWKCPRREWRNMNE